MIAPPEVSPLINLLTATLLVLGAAITLIGALGLVRLGSFYQRVHPPTLGTTLGVGCVALASMIYFSATGSRPILHEVLILIFVAVTTPITLIILVRATRLRNESLANVEQSGRE